MLAGSISLIFSAAVLTASDAPEEKWTQRNTPHFQIFHENPKLEAEFSFDIEKIGRELKKHLSSFAPWMSTGKIKIYLHKNEASFRASRFHPPEWSQAFAIPSERLVVLYPLRPASSMQKILTHELTHVIFESYFLQSGTSPPGWLNEGLAKMMEETSIMPSETRARLAQIKNIAQRNKEIPWVSFFDSHPAHDATAQEANVWYLQAYSLLRFLYTNYPRQQFLVLCDRIRQGKTIEKALWLGYGLRDMKTFDEKWKAWLSHAPSSFSPF